MRAVLTKLIDRELMLAEVDRYAPPEPTAEAVDGEVQRGAAAVPVARRASTRRSRAPGIDDTHLRETLRQDLRMRAYLDQRFNAASDRRRQARSTTGWPACAGAAAWSIYYLARPLSLIPEKTAENAKNA